jgi:hypothetical protein
MGGEVTTTHAAESLGGALAREDGARTAAETVLGSLARPHAAFRVKAGSHRVKLP